MSKFNRTDFAGRCIRSVVIVRESDTDPDLSYLGEYQANRGADDKTIDRTKRGAGWRQMPFWVAAMSAEDTGNPKSVEEDYARHEAYCAGDWWMVGVKARATVVLAEGIIQTLESGGLWGVESDSDDIYFKQTEDEQLEELRRQLLAAGFTDDEIKESTSPERLKRCSC